MDQTLKGRVKNICKKIYRSNLPVPRILRPVIRLFYNAGVIAREGFLVAYNWLIIVPVVRSIANSAGSNLRFEHIPYIRGHGRISIGSNVYVSGKIGVHFSSHPEVPPELIIGNNTFIGPAASFSVAKKIEVGSHCLISSNVSIMDNDGHPADPEARLRGEPVSPEKIKPVVIKDNVWIGMHSLIMKGVTIGEGSIVGASSVVLEDVPPNTLVTGNPAKMVRALKI